MTGSHLHSVSVAAVVVDEAGRALLVRRQDNGHWEPPGGVLEPDETIIDGLRREVAEETGLDVSIGELTGVYKNMTRAIVALVFRCRIQAGSLRTNDEVSEFRWMSLDEVSAEMDEAYAVRVVDALRGDAVTVRAHDGCRVLESATVPPVHR